MMCINVELTYNVKGTATENKNAYKPAVAMLFLLLVHLVNSIEDFSIVNLVDTVHDLQIMLDNCDDQIGIEFKE